MRHTILCSIIIAGLICLAADCCRDCPDPECPDPTNIHCPDYDSCLVFPDKCALGPRISKDSIHISWNTGSDIPIELGWTAASVLDNQIYISGGVSVASGISDLIQIYDPESDTWSISKNVLQHFRWGHSSSMINGLIYVMGGVDSTRGPALNSIEEFDPESGNWSTSGEMLKGRIGHGEATYNGKIYIFGGEFEEPSLTTLRTMEAYDPVNKSWETLAPMPNARIFMAVCVVEDTIYAIGGGSKYPYTGVKTIEAYNIAENTWERRADLKLGLLDLKACVVEGKIYCTGGSSMWTDSATSTVQVYDPKLDSVYLATNMQFTRAASSTVSINNKIYVISGYRAIKPEASISSKTEIGIPEF